MSPTAGRRSGRRVALVARYPPVDPSMPQIFISNHGLRMVEASLLAAGLDGLEHRVWDLSGGEVADLVKEIEAFDPDVIGFSAFLWSFPFFIEAAGRLKQADPTRLVVFGGPSARPSMMELPPYRAAKDDIDVLVINEGEFSFVEIVRLRDRRAEALKGVAGLALPAAAGWLETPARPLGDLNELASPYEMGLVPTGGLAVLQTYRGCPFTCSFCEWGTLDAPKRVRGADSLSAELSAMGENKVVGALLVDAGLNLNNHAFHNLEQAARQTGFLADRHLICEVYPARVRQEHIDFIASVGRCMVGIGLQSFDNDVLAHVERKYDERRFEDNLAQLTAVAGVAIEIIMGLPGDTPQNFRASFERARSYPCALRVYHCVVLPSALMVRAPANYRMDYDFETLKMRSCLGWSEQELLAEEAFLNDRAVQEDGETGAFFWVFPPPRYLT